MYGLLLWRSGASGGSKVGERDKSLNPSRASLAVALAAILIETISLSDPESFEFDEMDSIDLSADLTALPTNQRNTRLLSESPLTARSSHSNISSSSLSFRDPPPDDHSQSHAVNDEEDEVEEGLRDEGDKEDEEGGEDEEAQIRRARKAARMREEKLQNDLFLLKKLNSAFSLYTDALRATQSSTEVSRRRFCVTTARFNRSLCIPFRD